MTVKLNKIYFFSLICSTLAGCQAVTDTLSVVNGTLSSINSTLSGTTISTVAQSSADNAVNKAKASNKAQSLFNQAKPHISNYIALVACDTPSSKLAAYSDPDSMQPNGLGKPQHTMVHHKSGCLNILRIEKINRLAANAIEFQVVYISPQSEETARKTHRAIKQPNGEWLFNFWGI